MSSDSNANVPQRLLLVGCGRMGQALLGGWRQHLSWPLEVHIIEPNAEQHAVLTGEYGAQLYASVEALPSGFAPSMVMLAVKPQMLEAVLPALVERLGSAPLYLSIAAGKEMAFYASFLGEGARMVRIMPNTPSLIGKGVSGLVASPEVSEVEHQRATELMQAVGKAIWLEDEADMHALTALSGSGPAYVFHFAECLVAAGVAQGLPEPVAKELAVGLLDGSAALMAQSELPLAALRENVTSPGGTTAAALSVLMDDAEGLPPLVQKALAAAKARSEELAG